VAALVSFRGFSLCWRGEGRAEAHDSDVDVVSAGLS
jgi:hypothetical protein